MIVSVFRFNTMIVGTEWLIEAAGCNQDKLREESVLRDVFARIIGDLGLKIIDAVWHKFDGEGGVTGIVALTESHLACHTYPENGVATFNLYCCRTRPEWDWEQNLKKALGAQSVNITRIERGEERNAGILPAVPSASCTPKVSELKQLQSNRKLVSYGEVKIRERGRLPHWEKEDGIYFVTFRLADSLPTDILSKLEYERKSAEKVLANLERQLSESESRNLDWLFSDKVDEYLDNGYGNCQLRNTQIAGIVAGALKHFDGKRYNLFAWCVMPNHVHVVFQTRQRHQLDAILHSWKSYSSNEANKILGTTGEFWQREYYDRLIRDDEELARIVQYILNNPVKAGLKSWLWVDSLGKQRQDAAATATRMAALR